MLDTLSWEPADHVVFGDMDDGVALLDTERNIYYSLEGIAPFLWRRLMEGDDFAAMCKAVTGTFDIDHGTARADIVEWIGSMAASGLIVERHG